MKIIITRRKSASTARRIIIYTSRRMKAYEDLEELSYALDDELNKYGERYNVLETDDGLFAYRRDQYPLKENEKSYIIECMNRVGITVRSAVTCWRSRRLITASDNYIGGKVLGWDRIRSDGKVPIEMSLNLDEGLGEKSVCDLVAPLPGYYDVGAHGISTSGTYIIDGSQESDKKLSVQELAQRIKDASDYHGEKIRLLSCNTGRNGFAQNLAKAMGVEVIAPRDILWVNKKTGEITIAPRDPKNSLYPDSSRVSGFKKCMP